MNLSFSDRDIAAITSHPGWTLKHLVDEVKFFFDNAPTSERNLRDDFQTAYPELFIPFCKLPQAPTARPIRKGSEYDGSLVIPYLTDPYIPRKEITNVHGKSGCGKTFAVSLFCASTTTGKFPTESKEPGSVLYISAEESFAEIADRMSRAGGDLDRVFIFDREASVGMNFDDRIDDFREVFSKVHADLVVVDPWQAFCGDRINANSQTIMRPFLQRIVLTANEFDFALIFICHENKSQFNVTATDAISGSSEIANVARSCLKIVEDGNDPCVRHIVQTKSNHRMRGTSLKYRFLDNRIIWDGFSPLTKESLDEASRTRRTAFEVLEQNETAAEEHRSLITALLEEAQNTETCGRRISYSEFRLKHGESIFSGRQPKRALTDILPELQARNIVLKADLDIRRGSKHDRGFFIQKISGADSEN